MLWMWYIIHDVEEIFEVLIDKINCSNCERTKQYIESSENIYN